MIALHSSFKIDRIFYYANLCMGIGSSVIFTSLACVYFFYPWREAVIRDGNKSCGSSISSKGRCDEFYELIGTGAFSLSSGKLSPLFQHLREEIILLGRNARPDASAREVKMLIGLKSSKEEKIAVDGSPIYVDVNKKGNDMFGALHFSENDKGPIAIKPVSLEGNSVLIEVSGEEDGQFMVQERPLSPSGNKDKRDHYFHLLSQAKWWGTDILFQKYGGEEYKEMKDKQKLEFADKGSSYVQFVSQGDYLLWDEDQWTIVPLSSVSPTKPLAHVKSISSKGIEMEAWDETGFYSYYVKLQRQGPAKVNEKLETVFSSGRLQTSSQISCVLGKRRVILKPGDWLLKNGKGWHNLKKVDEIEDCLQHKIKGELFLFEGMEKEQGKIIIKGHIFDEMRTQIQPVSIPISTEKNKSKKKPSKTPPIISTPQTPPGKDKSL